MVRFVYTGPMPVGFDSIHREVGPGEEFDVPDELALAFANHGHCRPVGDADAAAVQTLRDAEQAEAARQDEIRAAAAAEHGLVNAHPSAPRYDPAPPVTGTPTPPAAKSRPAKTTTADRAPAPVDEAAPAAVAD